MKVAIKPTSQTLQTIINRHGSDGWTVLQNMDNCPYTKNKKGTLLSKNNFNFWATEKDIDYTHG